MTEDQQPTTADRRFAIRLTVAQVWTVIVAAVGVIGGSFGLGWKINGWISGGEAAKSDAKLAAVQEDLKSLTTKHDNLKATHEQLKTKEGVLRLFYLYHVARVEQEQVSTRVQLAQQHYDSLIPFKRPSRDRMAVFDPEAEAEARRLEGEYKKNVGDYLAGLPEGERQTIKDAESVLNEAKEELKTAKDKTFEAGKGFETLIHGEKDRAANLDIDLVHVSKGGGGKGTIKFAYDAMVVEIPNEFLPRAAH